MFIEDDLTPLRAKLREKEGRRWVFIEDDLTPLRAKLREKEGRRWVFIEDDLTPLRAKLREKEGRRWVFIQDDLTPLRAKLREKEGRRWVFIEDDLTPLRAKLVRELKADEHIKNVWTIDGRVFCTRTENGREVKKTIQSPEDLLSVELGFFMDLWDRHNHSITIQGDTEVKIMGLNMCGLRSKTQLVILVKYIQEFDFVCLSETKTDAIEADHFKNFTPITMERKCKKHKYGGIHGICVLVKKKYSKYIHTVQETCSESILWLKVDKEAFGHEFILDAVYLPHAGLSPIM